MKLLNIQKKVKSIGQSVSRKARQELEKEMKEKQEPSNTPIF